MISAANPSQLGIPHYFSGASGITLGRWEKIFNPSMFHFTIPVEDFVKATDVRAPRDNRFRTQSLSAKLRKFHQRDCATELRSLIAYKGDDVHEVQSKASRSLGNLLCSNLTRPDVLIYTSAQRLGNGSYTF